MWVGIISLFPEMFRSVTDFGVTGQAVKKGLLSIETWNPRDFTHDKHRTVDDRPYGGGPGMLMMVQPLRDAINGSVYYIQDYIISRVSPERLLTCKAEKQEGRKAIRGPFPVKKMKFKVAEAQFLFLGKRYAHPHFQIGIFVRNVIKIVQLLTFCAT